MPFKANAERRHHIPRQRHRAMNSAAYDAALRHCGSLLSSQTVIVVADATELSSRARQRVWSVLPSPPPATRR